MNDLSEPPKFINTYTVDVTEIIHSGKETMYKVVAKRADFPFLDKKQLINLKTKAMRSGAWFRVLKRIDRVLLDLTIKVVDNVHSATLAKSILALTRKLENTVRSNFSNSLQEIGLPLAQKISLVGQKLENISASGWAFDSSFIRFLAVLQINAGGAFNR